MIVSVRSFYSAAAAAFSLIAAGCSGTRTESSAPASPPPNSEISAPVQRIDSRPVIVAFGDSLSEGLGLDPDKSYPSVLQRLLDRAGYHYRVVNLGVSGDTTTDGVERLPSVLALHPAIVILEFGANDGLRGQPVASAKQNLATMITAIQKGGARVVLAGMTLPRNYGPDYIHSFERVYLDLATQYRLVRIPFLLDGVGGHQDLTQPDGLHPTAAGTEMVARTVQRYVQPLLSR